MGSLDGKTALVTGAGRGIGRAVGELLAAEGAEVVLVARSEDELQDLANGIRGNGGSARPAPGDITDDSFVETLFQTVKDEFGRLDILVNNAGIAPSGAVEDMAVQDFRRCLELNVVAVFACTQQAVRIMKDQGGEGKIINVGSVRSHWTEGGGAGAYNASKYGVRGLTESVARQLHGSGLNIAVSLICPGVVDTTLTNPNREERPDWLRVEDIARAVLHAATAPARVNVFDTIVIPMAQKPW